LSPVIKHGLILFIKVTRFIIPRLYNMHPLVFIAIILQFNPTFIIKSSISLIVGPEDLIKLQARKLSNYFCKEIKNHKISKNSLLNIPNELNNGKHIYNVL